MSLPIEVTALDVTYGDTPALRDVSFRLAGGSITGLLGRNGAGKSTLLATLAAFRRPTRGTVRIDGADPWENAHVVSEICLIREGGDLDGSMRVRDVLGLAETLRPRWDPGYAERLLDAFEVSARRRVQALSRGQHAAVAVTIGLATRAPVTLFDEPHLGMDAPSRYRFYEELITDYAAHPRTIVLSTHLIDEVAALLEDIVILDHGRVLTHQPALELQGSGLELTGPAAAVDDLTRNMAKLSERTLGPTKSVVVYGQFNGHVRERAAEAGIELGPIPLQDLFVSLTSQEHGS